MNWKVLSPNLSFTVENKMEDSRKKVLPHFKLNINDWDIQFPKILGIYQWTLGKTIGENRKSPCEFYSYHRMFGQKALKIYICSLCISIYTISEWFQETQVLILSLFSFSLLFFVF